MEMNQTLSHLSSVRYCDNVVWVSQQSGKGHILYLVHDKTILQSTGSYELLWFLAQTRTQ